MISAEQEAKIIIALIFTGLVAAGVASVTEDAETDLPFLTCVGIVLVCILTAIGIALHLVWSWAL